MHFKLGYVITMSELISNTQKADRILKYAFQKF